MTYNTDLELSMDIKKTTDALIIAGKYDEAYELYLTDPLSTKAEYEKFIPASILAAGLYFSKTEKVVIVYKNGRRNVEIYRQLDSLYRVQCCIGGTVSHAQPFKTFKTLSGAERYGNRFIDTGIELTKTYGEPVK